MTPSSIVSAARALTTVTLMGGGVFFDRAVGCQLLLHTQLLTTTTQLRSTQLICEELTHNHNHNQGREQ